jgi:hypothetical protein
MGLIIETCFFLPATELPNSHLLFAGGIHDAVSAAWSRRSQRLSLKGTKIGVLRDRHLFTQEAVWWRNR